jgi:hypothetical protein
VINLPQDEKLKMRTVLSEKYAQSAIFRSRRKIKSEVDANI